jgi:hypothetical protein
MADHFAAWRLAVFHLIPNADTPEKAKAATDAFTAGSDVLYRMAKAVGERGLADDIKHYKQLRLTQFDTLRRPSGIELAHRKGSAAVDELEELVAHQTGARPEKPATDPVDVAALSLSGLASVADFVKYFHAAGRPDVTADAVRSYIRRLWKKLHFHDVDTTEAGMRTCRGPKRFYRADEVLPHLREHFGL